MKLVLTLLILLTFEVKAQIKGSFCNSNTYHYSCINFLDEKHFQYSYSDCTRFREGRGTYRFRNNKLELTFTQIEEPTEKGKISFISKEVKNDSVQIIIQVFDKLSKELIPFSNVLLLDKDQKQLLYSMTNQEGLAKFSLPKSNDQGNIKINSLGFEVLNQNISLDKSYEGAAELIQGPTELVKAGEVWKWKVKKITENDLILKGRKGKIIIYKKN
ncbi:hypothetical protein H9Q13_10445 [Pontibacter sp. JH31]|uniref:Carboxypeptidase regulatory-like domain-containing protein n=1 Tax=Pontibacter aquaedesilientis TaxID=2766980 RepID=A0ABR7XJK0_9BACT|nr:hypothetical protein [Pontibacter aquaedesilientis]MBD1397586.1 hypothetical protein [Pontibacter aquaedesilientis]